MSIYKTRGIIINRTNFGEADRIVTILTYEHGKIKTIAKGVRKVKSHFGGNLEPFCLSLLNIAEGRNLDVITSAEIEKSFLNLRKKVNATKEAYYYSELIDKLTESNDPHPEIFNLLSSVLDNLNGIKSDILIPYFEWNLLSHLGYHPELYHCVNCRKKLKEDEKIYFNFTMGGIICQNCAKNDLELTTQVIKLLRLFLKHQILALTKIKIDTNSLTEVKHIARLYLYDKSDKSFKSQRFLK